MIDKNIKEIVDKYKVNSEERHQLIHELNSRVIKVIKRYIAAKYLGGSFIPHIDRISINWEIDGNSIEGRWDESWAYGGHEGDSFDIPLEYLIDETELKKYESDQRERIDTIKEQQAKRTREKELKQLEVLKEKYDK